LQIPALLLSILTNNHFSTLNAILSVNILWILFTINIINHNKLTFFFWWPEGGDYTVYSFVSELINFWLNYSFFLFKIVQDIINWSFTHRCLFPTMINSPAWLSKLKLLWWSVWYAVTSLIDCIILWICCLHRKYYSCCGCSMFCIKFYFLVNVDSNLLFLFQFLISTICLVCI